MKGSAIVQTYVTLWCYDIFTESPWVHYEQQETVTEDGRKSTPSARQLQYEGFMMAPFLFLSSNSSFGM